MISEKDDKLKKALKTELNNRIGFYKDISQSYPLELDEFEEYREAISKLEDKIKDERINFTVIGEFSTGKSTFINAFIKSRFLESKVLQGTTSAATVIEKGDEYKAILEFNDLTKNVMTFRDADDMKSIVNDYTVNSDNTQKIKKVTFTIPDITLDSKMRIIDTPGINVEYKWHEDVTRYSISDISDVVIVLIDATKVLPESLINFIDENLRSRIESSVFIVTKIDEVQEKEIEKILKYVRVKLMQEFSFKKPPVVLPYASMQVLDYSEDKSGMKPSEHNQRLLAMSSKTESILLNFFRANHLSYYAKSFQSNESVVRSELKHALEAYAKKLYDDVNIDDDVLNRSRQFRPEFFRDNQKIWRGKSFNQSSGKIYADLSGRMQFLKSNHMSRTNFEAYNNPYLKKSSPAALKNFFVDFFMSHTNQFIEESQRYFDMLKSKYVYEMCTFLNMYKKTCDNINILHPTATRKEYCEFINKSNPEIEINKYRMNLEEAMENLFIRTNSSSVKYSIPGVMRSKAKDAVLFAETYYCEIIAEIMNLMVKQTDIIREKISSEIDLISSNHKKFIDDRSENSTLYLMDYAEKREIIDTDLSKLALRK